MGIYQLLPDIFVLFRLIAIEPACTECADGFDDDGVALKVHLNLVVDLAGSKKRGGDQDAARVADFLESASHGYCPRCTK